MEQKHRLMFSLKQKAAILAAALALILAAAMFLFGMGQYVRDMSENYAQRALQVADTAAMTLDQRILTEYVDRVVAIYEENQDETEAEEYLAEFAGLEEEAGFQEMRRLLEQLEKANGAQAIYVRADDETRGRDLYILDGDMNPQTRFPTGFWQEYSDSEMTFFTKNGIIVYINTLYLDDVRIGNMFTVEVPIEDPEGTEIAFLGVDLSVREMEKSIQTYIRGLILWLLVFMAAVMAVVFRAVNRSVVKPLTTLTQAASGYVKERNRQEKMPEVRLLSHLEIQTGDEMEELCSALKSMEAELLEYGSELARVGKEQERIATELTIAAQIQSSMLPKDFPQKPEFQLYAMMVPAKEVGGDFYDFFLIDEDHLALVIADVSGKGVAAALFMSVAKLLLKNCVRQGKTPEAVLTEVNHQLCENNEAELFVTVWLGIYEISTGKLTAANGGHEYPMIKRKDGRFEIYKDVHGFVLGMMEPVSYRGYELLLEPGDILMVYTDGVPEATDRQQEQYGIGRILEALNRQEQQDAMTLIHTVKRDLDLFVGTAPQFDDVTMLCFMRQQ